MAIGNIFFLKQYFVSKQCSRGSKREINRIIRSSIGFLLYFFSSRFLEFVLVFIIDFKTFKWIEKYFIHTKKAREQKVSERPVLLSSHYDDFFIFFNSGSELFLHSLELQIIDSL
jgi:hypothetical protein